MERWGQKLADLKILYKIGFGYALALGISVSGTLMGFAWGDYHQKRAALVEDQAREELQVLHRLQISILQTRLHQQQLVSWVDEGEEFNREYQDFLKYATQINQDWSSFKATFGSHHDTHGHIHTDDIVQFLNVHDQVFDRYRQSLDQSLAEVIALYSQNPTATLPPGPTLSRIQSQLITFNLSEITQEFDIVSHQLSQFGDIIYEELETAESQQVQARNRAEIVMGISIGLSGTIALGFAFINSRIIARPIQTLTRIARQSITEANFDLQVDINQRDEVGILANTFNQLTRSVQHLLEEQKAARIQLANYNQTLATEVEIRTQELYEKNQELEQLLTRLQRTQLQMVQSEKMSALGQMVAGIAHEINNPVNFIHGNLGHVAEYGESLLKFLEVYGTVYPDPNPTIAAQAEDLDIEFIQEDLPKVLESMKVGTERIRQIVLSLRNFSRTDETDIKAVDLHEGLENTLLILQHRLKEKPEHPAIEVVRDYGTLPLVECYPGQLNQAFMNILANAIDALEETHGQSTYQEIQQHPGQITIITRTPEPQWVEVTIKDNGPGMPEAVRQRIFDPFFTTKPVGKGTGMGMPITYQVVHEKHHGKLSCSSTPGEGTRFVLKLPITQPRHG